MAQRASKLSDRLRFWAKIVTMGNKKIVIIPTAYHEQIKDFDEKKKIMVILTQVEEEEVEEKRKK